MDDFKYYMIGYSWVANHWQKEHVIPFPSREASIKYAEKEAQDWVEAGSTMHTATYRWEKARGSITVYRNDKPWYRYVFKTVNGKHKKIG